MLTLPEFGLGIGVHGPDEGVCALWEGWALPTLSAGFIAVAAVGALEYPDHNGTSRHWWLFAVIAGTFGGAVVQALASILQSRRLKTARAAAEKATQQQIIRMQDSLDPIVSKLASAAAETTPEERQRLHAAITQQVLGSVGDFIDKERVRVCWFTLRKRLDGKQELVCTRDYIGRVGEPRSAFLEGTTDGDAALALISGRTTRFCPDVDKSPPPGWDSARARSYKTFISAPAIAGDKGYGMLTMDAPNAGELKQADASLLQLLATLIAAASALADR